MMFIEQILVAGNTLIRELPEDFGNLQNLETLGLKFSLIHKLPKSFTKLKVHVLFEH